MILSSLDSFKRSFPLHRRFRNDMKPRRRSANGRSTAMSIIKAQSIRTLQKHL
jgi:hypothetical protein